MAVELERETFARHLNAFYKQWEASNFDVDCVVLVTGKAQQDVVYMKSTSFQTYLFQYEFPETIIIFAEKEVVFFSSPKKLEYFKQLEPKSKDEYKGLTLRFLEKAKDNDAAYSEMWSAMKASKTGERMGVIAKDKHTGAMIDSWNAFLDSKDPPMEKVDAGALVGMALAVKDGDELAIMKRAAALSSKVMDTFFRSKLESIIEDEKKMKHSALADLVEQVIQNPEQVKVQINAEYLETCYTPIIQSGGKYDLRPSATSDDSILSADVVVASLGSRYKMYCSNVGRTYLINPTKSQEENYKLLEKLRAHAIAAMKPGASLSEVYGACVSFLEAHKPALRTHLTKTLGFGMGIEFRDSQFVINAKNPVKVKNGMTFNLAIGLENLENPEATGGQPKTYALYLADTIVIQTGETMVLTDKCPLKFNDIVYTLGDEDEGDEKENEEAKSKPEKKAPKSEPAVGRSTRSGAVLSGRTRNADRTEPTDNEKLRLNQVQLLEKINKEARDRLVHGTSDNQQEKLDINHYTAYKNVATIPHDRAIRDQKLFLDRKNDALLCPVFGQVVPFHINMIKNVSIVKGDTSILRINFNIPTATGRREGVFAFAHPEAAWIRELTYRSADMAYLDSVATAIRDHKKTHRIKETELKEKADLVKQDALRLGKGNQPSARLKNLLIRPPINNKLRRAPGVLDAHENGFRYTTAGGVKLDILYNNIRFAFFQPCKHEEFACLHFTLKNPIKGPFLKKQTDIQFFTPRSMDSQIETGSRQTNYRDADEIELEQRERENQKKLDGEFRRYIQKVEDEVESIRFEKPERSLAFNGKWSRSMMTMMPTSSALVSLTEWPTFVMPLEDIEFVHLERTQFGSRSFDIVAVPKDYKKCEKVESIDIKYLDTVKQWLNECGICFTEASRPLKWDDILKIARENPREFFDDEGGWVALFGEDEEEEEDDMDDDDAEFAPEESDMEEEESESEYSEEESDESEYSEESDEGEDWSDIEEWARKEDRKHYEENDDDEDDRGKKRKSGKSAPPPAKKKARK